MNPGYDSEINACLSGCAPTGPESREKPPPITCGAANGFQAEESLGDQFFGRGRPDIAVAHYEKGLLLEPVAPSLALKYHRAILATNAFARAEAILRQVGRRTPRDRRLDFLLIDILVRQDKWEAAMDEIEAAMAYFGIDDGMVDAAVSVRSRLGTYRRANTPSVSLCMIVKNEAHHLARCLRSVKPIVDDIVVVDTGSVDRSADIARAFGARVYLHLWSHDFSEARNVSISKASGEWIMVLDADEVVSPKDYAPFRKIVAGAPTSAYTVRTRNYTHEVNTVGWQPNTGEDMPLEAGTGWFPSEKVRLFPKVPKVMFKGAVHELVEPSLRAASIPIRACELQVHHYGKLKEAQTRSKTRTYAELEQRKLQESADRPGSLREAAIQAGRLGRHSESIDLWRRFLADRPDSAEAYVNLSAACLQSGRYDEAVSYAASARRASPSMREAHVNLALAAIHRGDANRAVAVLEPLLRREPSCLQARFLLGAAHLCLKEPQASAATLQPIRATSLGAVLAVSFRELSRSLMAAGQAVYAGRLLEAVDRKGFEGSETEVPCH